MGAAEVLPSLRRELAGFDGVTFRFHRMMDVLKGAGVMGMVLDDLEKLVTAEGRELMRMALQAVLDRRAEAQKVEPVTAPDGKALCTPRHLPVSLETTLGEVTVHRVGMSAPGARSVVALDGELNLPRRKYSDELRRRVAEAAVHRPFDGVVEEVAKSTAGRVPKRQAELVTQEAAVDFERFYRERQVRGVRESAGSGSVLVLSVDAVGMPVVKRARRDPTVEAVPNTGLMVKRRPGQKPGHSRMAGVGVVYTVAPYFRGAAEVLGDAGDTAGSVKRPRPEHKHCRVSIKQDLAWVVEQCFEDALLRDDGRKAWVALVDGNNHQIDVIQRLARQHGKKVTIIVDIWHVASYVWAAGRALHPDNDDAARTWVHARLTALLEGTPARDVAAGIRRSGTLRGLAGGARKAVDECCDYLLNKQEFLDYARYLREGYPVGTGVVEGTGRSLVKDRMALTGARWNLETAEAVLRLRALHHNGDLEDYWEFHAGMEKQRNHPQATPGEAGPLAEVIPLRRKPT